MYQKWCVLWGWLSMPIIKTKHHAKRWKNSLICTRYRHCNSPCLFNLFNNYAMNEEFSTFDRVLFVVISIILGLLFAFLWAIQHAKTAKQVNSLYSLTQSRPKRAQRHTITVANAEQCGLSFNPTRLPNGSLFFYPQYNFTYHSHNDTMKQTGSLISKLQEQPILFFTYKTA